MQVITLTPEQRDAAEHRRLQRAVAQAPDYTLERIGTGRGFRVTRNGASYFTTETSCTCEDARQTGLRCKHQCMVIARLEAEPQLSLAELARRSAQALRDREVLWG